MKNTKISPSEIRKKLLDKFGGDPLYKDVITAKNQEEQ